MSIEATAEALVAEPAAPIETPEISEDMELGAVFDRANAEPEQEEPEKVPETPVEAAEEPEHVEAEADVTEEQEASETPAPELPGNLPPSLREHLSKMPQEAVDAVLTDRDDLHRRLSDMGRQVHGIAPVRDVLVDAAKTYPHLSSMKPEQVGQQLLAMAQVGDRLAKDPVGTLMQTAKQHGVEQALAERLSGQPVSEQGQAVPQLMQTIEGLQRKIAQLEDPEYFNERVTQITSEKDVQTEVLNFSTSDEAKHWSDVEEHIPAFIPIARAKLGEGAAPSAVLKLAYEQAIQTFKPEAVQAPKAEAVADPSPAPDPEKTKAAVKAKSVNVTGKQTGKPKVLTEDEELSAIYDKSSKR